MYKIVALLGIPAVVLLLVVWKSETENHLAYQGVKNVLEKANQTNPDTLGLSTSIESPLVGWERKDFEKLGFSISHPTEVSVYEKEASIEVSGDNLSVLVRKQSLPEKENINTQAEKEIDRKMLELGDAFELVESIEPIAIGSVTGVTYTTLESGNEVTYYYVPERNSFLFIQNNTDHNNPDKLSVSDKIVYSLEFLAGF